MSAVVESVSSRAAPVQTTLRDFSDRFSPMLVKELRQGLKSHVFTWGLIAMQLSLIFVALISMTDGTNRDVNTGFWWSVAGPVCLLLPMRVANALRDEMSANTLDTLLLTRLSAWRITLGKWLATCALQVLVTASALPYLILRYFAGGVDMPLEIAWLAVYVLFGMVTTAVMLGLSWFPHFLIRAVVMLGVLGLAAGFCGGTIDEISRTNNYGLDELYSELRWPGLVFSLTLIVWGSFFCLDLGAARLAPLSENRSTRRRLAAFAVLGICGPCSLATYPDRDVAPALAIILTLALTLPAVQAISERPVHLAPILLPFVKRGLPGRLAGRLLYPGWHTGLFFTLLLFACAACILAWQFLDLLDYSLWHGYSHSRSFGELIMLLSTGGTVLGIIAFPLVAWRLTGRMARWDFWRWLLLMTFAGAFHLFVTVLGAKKEAMVLYANYLLPTGGAFVLPGSEQQTREELQAVPFPENYRQLSRTEQFAFLRQRDRQLDEMLAYSRMQHGTIAGISLLSWLMAAVWFACREMRSTRLAERTLL